MELMVVLALVGILCGIAVPAFTTYYMKRSALVGMVRELGAALRLARQEAITRNSNVGLKFEQLSNGHLRYRKYLDGNGNGVLSKDILRGVDPPLGSINEIAFSEGRIHLGVLDPSVTDVWTGQALENTDPIRFGNSNICSFSPLGACSPGTIYFTDGVKLQGAVRVYPMSAKIRVMRYEAASGWREF